MNLTVEQQVWFDDQTKRPEMVNPCIRAYGLGPAGQTCRGCVHLWCHQMSRRYWKCDLRTCSHGAATDHRVNWPACARYQARPTKQPNPKAGAALTRSPGQDAASSGVMPDEPATKTTARDHVSHR